MEIRVELLFLSGVFRLSEESLLEFVVASPRSLLVKVIMMGEICGLTILMGRGFWLKL